MRRNRLFTIGLLLLLALTRCTPEKKVIEIKKINLVPVDTIKINYSGTALILGDKHDDKLVLFDFFNHEILVTDIKGTVLSKFGHTDLGADDLGKTLLGVKFQSDTSIYVVSDAGYFICNLKGNVLKRFKHSVPINKLYITGEFKLSYDPKRNMLASLVTNQSLLGSNVPEFYDEATHMTFYKLDSQKSLVRIKYEEESTFKQKKYYNGEWAAHFALNGDSVAMIYGRDPVVYLYALSDFRKVTSFKTDPEHFTQPVQFKFGDFLGNDHKRRLTSFANSCYQKIFAKNDTIIATYYSGVPLEKFDEINDVNDLSNIGYQFQQYYMQLFINGKKEYADYELPKEFPLLEIVSGNQLILAELAQYDTKHDGNKRFLIMNFQYPKKDP